MAGARAKEFGALKRVWRVGMGSARFSTRSDPALDV